MFVASDRIQRPSWTSALAEKSESGQAGFWNMLDWYKIVYKLSQVPKQLVVHLDHLINQANLGSGRNQLKTHLPNRRDRNPFHFDLISERPIWGKGPCWS